MDEFSKNLRRGVGVISDPKNFVAVFAVILRGKTMNFWEKGGGSLQSKKFVAKKRNIVFRNEGGRGGSEAVWKFSKNSSKIEQGSVFQKTSCLNPWIVSRWWVVCLPQ